MHFQKAVSLFEKMTGGASAVALSCCLASPLMAQSAATSSDEIKSAETDPAADTENIIITGSRIARTGYDTPNPISVLDEKAIKLRGYQNPIELFQSLPSIAPSRTNQLTNDIGRAQVNLRGLGPARTLLLVDGRRVAATSATGGVDINILPASLFKRVEVATGGASAAYGSDAVAGAVSISLDTEFTGLRGEVQYGQTTHGDGQAFSASLTAGTRFADGRGRLIVAGDYYDNKGVPKQGNRDWGDDDWGVLTNPTYVRGGPAPRQYFLPNLSTSQISYGGVIISPGPLQWTQFVGNGQTAPFTRGTLASTTFMVGGDGVRESRNANVTPKVERSTAFARASFELAPEAELYAEGLYSRSRVQYFITTPFDNGTLTIRSDNAYLPNSVRNIMLANGIASFRMGRWNSEFGYYNPVGTTEVMRLVGGLKGRSGTWRWDTFFQYSRNNLSTVVNNNRHTANWLRGIDAVVNPANGQIVCRSTLTDPTNGCIPVNLFGNNTISPAALSYVRGSSVGRYVNVQRNAALNLSGQLFQGWAGPISLATGLEYRNDTLEGTSDPVSMVTGWQVGNPQPVIGSNRVVEGYAEILVPLLRDRPLFKALELNTAARYTNYRISGGVWTWKVGLDWSITDWVRLRGTVSRDIRAPNLSELFTKATIISGGTQYFDRFTNTNVPARSITSGNPNLKPEIARSYTAGIVLEPSWIEGLRLSVDYYDVTIRDAISTFGTQDTIDRCYAGQTAFCPNLIRDSQGVLIDVRSPFLNQNNVKTNGVDFAASYRRPLGSGTFSINALASYVAHLTNLVDSVVVDTAGQVVGNGTPHWKGTITTDYSTGPLSVSAQVRLIQGGIYNATWIEGVDINDNSVAGRAYLDLSGTYMVRPNIQIFAKIDNVFDRDPPIAPFTGGLNPQASLGLHYDNIGRYVSVGVRVKL